MSAERLDLYAAAAQVIPVLLLALAVELQVLGARALSPQGARSMTARISAGLSVATPLLIIALLVVGEAAALYALADESTRAARNAVLTSLFGGGLMLVLALMEIVVRPLVQNAEAVETARNSLVVIATCLWLLA